MIEAKIANNSLGEVAIRISESTPRKRSKLRAILKKIPRVTHDARCLDIGTAHGGLAYHFAKDGQWSFVDSNNENLQVARSILRGGFFCEDALSFIRQNKGFSLITCLDTLMYFDDPTVLLKEFYDAMLLGGHVLITGTSGNQRNILIQIREYLGLEKAHQFNVFMTADDVKARLRSCGFVELTQIEFCGFFTEALQTLIDYISFKKLSEKDGLVPNLTQMQSIPKDWQLIVTKQLSFLCQALDFLIQSKTKYGYLIVAEKW